MTRYADVRGALADPRMSLNKANAAPGGYKGFVLPPALDANLLNMDPPDHTRLRSLVTSAFTHRRVSALRPRVREIADELIDAFAGEGHAELMAEFASPLPLLVIAELLGVPADRWHDFRMWTNTLLIPGAGDPAAAIGKLAAFFTDLIAAKRRASGHDLLSALLPVRDDELTSLAFLMLFAGHESSAHHIGNVVLALLKDPELARSPAAASEEVLRHDTPGTLAIRRFTTEPIVIAGRRIPAGDTVLLALGSANRDPAQFKNPDTVDIARSETGHVAFGHGIHYCLGASLARVESEVAVGALLDRLPDLRLATTDLRQRGSFRNRGLVELPVTFSAAHPSRPTRNA